MSPTPGSGDLLASHSSKTLPYTVASASSYNPQFPPDRILVDNSADVNSRWAAARPKEGYAEQWLLLRLTEKSVLRKITFGKHCRQHASNIRAFAVYAGPAPDKLTEVLSGQLNNSGISETFECRWKNRDGVAFPSEYVKIVPIDTHSPQFMPSIWHVSLAGLADPGVVANVTAEYASYCSSQTTRLILAHLRRSNQLAAFTALQSSSPHVQLEIPLLTSLHSAIVSSDGTGADWDAAEALLDQAAREGWFAEYIARVPPKARWRRIDGEWEAGREEIWPRGRGGHQMCWDGENDAIWMFGGYDGEKDLADLWRFDCATETWTLIDADTSSSGGPSPRSCHKLAFDDRTGHIYLLGKFYQALGPGGKLAPPGSESLSNDFWRYATRGARRGEWERLSADTSAEGGPKTIWDHQMVLSSDEQVLYLFGGKCLQIDGSFVLSGMFKYDILGRSWIMVFGDVAEGLPAAAPRPPARFGHIMLHDPIGRQLLIFAGQRDDALLTSTWSYSLSSSTSTLLPFPSPEGFAQRATYDASAREVHLYSGESFWVWRLADGGWTELEPVAGEWEPEGRYAHQMVRDKRRGVEWVFGGNPGEEGSVRLDDLWEVGLKSLSAEEVLRRAKFMVRRQRFLELCRSSPPAEALLYLQTNLSAIVDHADPAQSETFRALMAHLARSSSLGVGVEDGANEPASREQRTRVFEDVGRFFGRGERQPDEGLGELLEGGFLGA